jgi:glucose-6-phosphate 1-epimerase
VQITGAIDRVYEAAPLETAVVAKTGKPIYALSRESFKDIVVWNPYVEGAASMGDFEPKDGWKNMVIIFPIMR